MQQTQPQPSYVPPVQPNYATGTNYSGNAPKRKNMYDVFISYSSKDQKTADAVVNYLESAKVKCWIAYRDADAGTLYSASIMKAMKNSSIFLLVFSENSNKSQHVLKEIDAACKYEKIIIPFKIDACQLDDAVEYYLSATHWLDAISAPMDNHLKDLVKVVNKYLGKKEEVPPSVGSEASQSAPSVDLSSKDETEAQPKPVPDMKVTKEEDTPVDGTKTMGQIAKPKDQPQQPEAQPYQAQPATAPKKKLTTKRKVLIAVAGVVVIFVMYMVVAFVYWLIYFVF
jgi:hypothetical protein